ncbi:MAG: flagellar hook-associated protein FlgK, partial [Sedimentisphaerales bacterium]|nr:flagellar hook-associated protein FlgK [Sedimentisphaerales bacterium]
ATEGYHRQRLELTPAYSSQVGSLLLGGGVDVNGVVRLIDNLLEQQIIRQKSLSEHNTCELTTLQTIETAFGELSSGSSLSSAIDEFFTALQDLSANPNEIVWQNQVVTAGQNLAGQFRNLGDFLTRLESQIQLGAEETVAQINTLIKQIAELNDNIERTEISGGQANNLRDQRDQRITALSELVGVEVQNRQYGGVDVIIAGVPVVTGQSYNELEVGLDENGYIGISNAGSHNYNVGVQGGRLGGLLSLRNQIINDIHTDMDTLAGVIIQQINQLHVQAVGSQGQFTELTGCKAGENLADLDTPARDGKIYIRVTNTSTGEVTRHEINISAATDSLSTVAEAISAIPGLDASVNSLRLHIQAEAGYKFDFTPAVLPEPTTSNLTAVTPPSISVTGLYNGSENQTFTFTATAGGTVGNGSVWLEVRTGAGEVVTTINIGAGYAAGDKLDIGNGIKISVSTGDLNAGDSFTVDVYSSTDTLGLLAALGINTFFSGSCAADIAVCSDLVDSPGRIATSQGADLTDNTNALRLADLKNQAQGALGGRTIGEFYNQIVVNVGQQVSVRQMQQDNLETMVQNLVGKRNEISGVNINDEAAQMLIFEQMFQAMAKYLTIVQSSMQTIMEII